MKRFETADMLPEQVNVSQIDGSPGPFSMSYGFDIKPLLSSIRRIGLINSPILIERGEGERKNRFSVVAGFKRIKAFVAFGAESIPCRILPCETPAFECLLINLLDNLTVREFNSVEKGMALARLLKWVPEAEVLKTYMPLLDLPSHQETLHLFVRIDRDFEPLAKDLIVGGLLSMKAARLLLEMDSASRETFCWYFSAIGFSKNQQTQFIDLINDLSHIEARSVKRLLDLPELRDICESPQMNGPQKAKALIKWLRTRRLPNLVRAEKSFNRMVETLVLPAGCQITPPPFFEGLHYRCEIFFKNGRDLHEKLSLLAKKEGLLTFEDPWKRIV